MALYETVFMARQELSQAQVDELTETYSKIIKDAKGKILKTENWGLRTLAYKINKTRKAHYVLVEFEAGGEAVAEMERVMRLNEDVLRYMTIKLEKPSEGPSAILGKDGDKEYDKKDAA